MFSHLRAIKTGAKKPLLVNLVKNKFDLSGQVSLLAALEAAHIVSSSILI
jgi:hypothetical protein